MTCSFLAVQPAREAAAGDIVGEPIAGAVELNEATHEAVSLATARGSRRITWLIVQNRKTNSNGSVNAKNLLVGDAGNQVIELAPGASTPPLPLNELGDVYARSL